MPRNMSFSMTTAQMRNRTKTVTRRQGWRFLKVGDVLCAIEKGQGLAKGEKVKRICMIRVVSLRREHGCNWNDYCTRIEFEYLDQ